jgi:hypothetical protein
MFTFQVHQEGGHIGPSSLTCRRAFRRHPFHVLFTVSVL